MTIFCLRSADQTSDNLLLILGNQNKLETKAWRVVSRRNEGGGALLVIGIDELSREPSESSAPAAASSQPATEAIPCGIGPHLLPEDLAEDEELLDCTINPMGRE